MSKSNFTTLVSTSEAEDNDLYLTNQGYTDGVCPTGDLLGLLTPVGTLIRHGDINVTPEDRGFPGTWEIVEEAVAFRVDEDSRLGELDGGEVALIPLPYHTHSAFVGAEPAHRHSYDYVYTPGSPTDPSSTTTIAVTGEQVAENTSTTPDHTHTVTINVAGESNPSVDITARKLVFVTWKRVS
jgi:hypothetical protein